MCVALSSVEGLVPALDTLDGRGSGPRKPHWAGQPWKRGRGRGRQRGDREALHCGWRGHGRAHGPVEKVLMHVSGPERFGESRPLLCPLGWDRQASLCLSACFLDNSTSCMLPVRQETAPACETKGSRPCHLLTLKLLISWDDRRWQGRGTALGALAW